jgi:hypothetical protein
MHTAAGAAAAARTRQKDKYNLANCCTWQLGKHMPYGMMPAAALQPLHFHST